MVAINKTPDSNTIKKNFLLIAFVVVLISVSCLKLRAGILETTKKSHKSRKIQSSSSVMTTMAKEVKDVPLLDLPPSVNDLVINIGSNLVPIMLGNEFGPCAHAIAVEPIVGCKIPPHRQLSVINAAVADEPGVMSMRIYNTNGVSSSLATIAKDDFWNTGRENGKLAIVPVITLTSLLNSIPPFSKIAMLMTDIQGLDFSVIKEGAQAFKEKVTHAITEVWLDDNYSYDAQNDLCRDWLPFMEELGYTITGSEGIGRNHSNHRDVLGTGEQAKAYCKKWLEDHPKRPSAKESPGFLEENIFWVRNDAIDQPHPKFGIPKFTEEEYATCN